MRRDSSMSAWWIAAIAAFGLSLAVPYDAQADETNELKIVGSTHGQNYQGVVNPGTGAAASIPLSICDNSQTPERYQNLANITDLTDPSILIPAGNIVVWKCGVSQAGVNQANFLFRYTGGFSAKAYGNIAAPYVASGTPNPASLFTSIVPGGAGCVAVAGNPKTDPGTGRQYNSFQNCSEKVLVQADFATSDTKGSAFASNMCDPQTVPSCAHPILDVNIGTTSFPITATPFAIIVGNGVQKCDPVTKQAAGKISLTRAQVEMIYDGSFKTWNQLGYCVYPVATLSPPDATLGAGAGDMSPIGTPFNAGIDQSIVTCSRPVTAGTRIIYDAVFHKDTPEVSFGTIGPPFSGDINYLAPTVSDGLACVQGRSAAPVSPANMNAITYNRADEAANPLTFGDGNVGRMRGGYPVPIDGLLPSNYTAPAVIQNPSDNERADSQVHFRCGRYAFWSDWVGVQRNIANPKQALWDLYVSQIAALLPKTTTGYFWAKNTRQPGKPVVTEMLAQKADAKGPIKIESGDHTGNHQCSR